MHTKMHSFPIWITVIVVLSNFVPIYLTFRMPFSIRRLAHLNRSHSLQSGKNAGDKASNSLPEKSPKTTGVDQQQAAAASSQCVTSSSSKSSKSSTKQSKSSSSSKHKSSNDAGGASSNSVNQLMALASQQHHHQQQQQHHQQHQSQNQPPSFVIRNQTTIHGSAFHPPAPNTGGGSKYEPAMPNSRSFDSNEIRRLTNAAAAASNQSSKLAYMFVQVLMKYSLPHSSISIHSLQLARIVVYTERANYDATQLTQPEPNIV